MLYGCKGSFVTIGDGLFQSSENFPAYKKLSCSIAVIGELTQTTRFGHLTEPKEDIGIIVVCSGLFVD